MNKKNNTKKTHTRFLQNKNGHRARRLWVNAFTAGNPFFNSLQFSLGRGFGVLKGLRRPRQSENAFAKNRYTLINTLMIPTSYVPPRVFCRERLLYIRREWHMALTLTKARRSWRPTRPPFHPLQRPPEPCQPHRSIMPALGFPGRKAPAPAQVPSRTVGFPTPFLGCWCWRWFCVPVGSGVGGGDGGFGGDAGVGVMLDECCDRGI